MNKVILIGNIAQDIELRKTTNNTSVCEFTVVTNEYSKGEQVPEYHVCQAWGTDAESICKYLGKGSKIAVEGRLHTEVYEGKNGKVRKTVVVVSRKEFLSPKEYTERSVYTEPEEKPHTPSVSTLTIETDELPFY